MSVFQNPYREGSDEAMLWEVLIKNDFEAFVSGKWELISEDFIEEEFYGIDGNLSHRKVDWNLKYYHLELYKSDWLQQSKDFNAKNFVSDPLRHLYETTRLSIMQIREEKALVHKEFNAKLDVVNDEPIYLNWISLFMLRKVEGKWKIASFLGYLPKDQ